MHHELDTGRSGEMDNPRETIEITNRLQAEESVGGHAPSEQPDIDPPAKPSVEPAFLTCVKRETPSDRGPRGQ
jgi:hypothetical protein